MLLWNFLLRIVSASAAFLYPGYASYKTLAQRPANEADLERWLMYWSVLGCIVAVEYVAEWLVSWLPLYYSFKTVFLLYLAFPQASGSSYLYREFLQPFFASHESEIDNALAQFKVYAYQSLQRLLRAAWNHVTSTLGQMQAPGTEAPIPQNAAAQSGAPPSLGDPASGPIQAAQSLWQSYGPSILAGGAVLLRQAQTSVAQASRAAEDQQRRHPQRDDFASEYVPPVSGYSVDPPSSPEAAQSELVPPANNRSRNSSDSSLRERTKSTFEEVEVPSDMEGDDGQGQPVSRPPAQNQRTSWFGWGTPASPGQGYERVKQD